MQVIRKSDFEFNSISGEQYQDPNTAAFWVKVYVDHLVNVARRNVGTADEKIAVLKSALTCAYQRVLKDGDDMAWPEALEGCVLAELKRLLGKDFPKWADQNLPFISPRDRRSRIKLAIANKRSAPDSKRGDDQEKIDSDAAEVEAQQQKNSTNNISQQRGVNMEALEYLNKIQKIMANQSKNEQEKYDDILKLLRKDLSAHMYFPSRWLEAYPRTIQALRKDLRREFSWVVRSKDGVVQLVKIK
jgi:hypothetical protein